MESKKSSISPPIKSSSCSANNRVTIFRCIRKTYRQEAIFERFIQAGITGKHANQRAGLGLTISKSYVEMPGGKIWLESDEGIGPTFNPEA